MIMRMRAILLLGSTMTLCLNIFFLVGILATANGGNIDVGQCSINSGCLQCISSQSAEVQRCQELFFLVTQTSNHEADMELYCTGNCPIVLSTANYYCGSNANIIRSVFTVCRIYSVLPTGSEGIYINNKRNCLRFINQVQEDEECIHRQSENVLRCLQHYLLIQHTNNTNYRNTFCTGDCPLTVTTSNWYTQFSNNPNTVFSECSINENGRYCAELSSELVVDPDVMQCGTDTICTTECENAIEKYGCCLVPQINIMTKCDNVNDCTVETGGSPAHLTTPLLLITMLILSSFALF